MQGSKLGVANLLSENQICYPAKQVEAKDCYLAFLSAFGSFLLSFRLNFHFVVKFWNMSQIEFSKISTDYEIKISGPVTFEFSS